MKVTKEAIDYQAAPYGRIAYIPAGVAVVAATNIPVENSIPKYWVQPWAGMDEKAESWQRNYGFLVDWCQVTEAPFQVGQRVRIKPSKRFPGRVRYGIIQGMTQRAGMSLVNEDRTNDQGEWAFIVASWKNPLAGALWHSAAGLEPMKRI